MEENEPLVNFNRVYLYIIKKLWLVNAILASAALLYNQVTWAMGFLVGSAAAHFFFFMLRRDIKKMADTQNFSPGKAFAGHLYRYLGVGLIFALVISSGFANIFATFTGFFMFHIILFLIKLSGKEEKE